MREGLRRSGKIREGHGRSKAVTEGQGSPTKFVEGTHLPVPSGRAEVVRHRVAAAVGVVAAAREVVAHAVAARRAPAPWKAVEGEGGGCVERRGRSWPVRASRRARVVRRVARGRLAVEGLGAGVDVTRARHEGRVHAVWRDERDLEPCERESEGIRRDPEEKEGKRRNPVESARPVRDEREAARDEISPRSGLGSARAGREQMR